MSDRILYSKSGHVAYITINRPTALNALDPQGWQELADVFKEAKGDKDVWVVIITGTGEKSFCAGADLKETIPRLTAGTLNITDLDDALLKHMQMWKPIIAAVNGYCLAGGMELLEATDIRIAAENAQFGLPEPRWGIIPAGGSLVRLVRQLPYVHAMEILLTGRQLTAQEALRIGIVNRVVPQSSLMEVAQEYANMICSNGPTAVQTIKESVIRLLSVPYDMGFNLEPLYAERVFRTQDAKEGPKAFAEKRKPNFQGQ